MFALTIFILFYLIICLVSDQTEVIIKNPTMSLSNSYCLTHPFVLKFKADKKSIKNIHSNAFNVCTSVTTILLNGNQIINLAPDTFKSNNKLEILQLGENLIEEIEDILFSTLVNLKILGLGSNRLKYFNAEAVRNCINLQTIYLQGNEILNIDEKSLLMHLSALKAIGFNNNDIACKRVEQITFALKSRGVKKLLTTGKQRHRNYSIKKHEGIDCIDGLNGRVIESLITIETNINHKYFSQFQLINTRDQILRKDFISKMENSKNEIKLLSDFLNKTVKLTSHQLIDFKNEVMKNIEKLVLTNKELKNNMEELKDSYKKLSVIQKTLQLDLEDIVLTTQHRVTAIKKFCNSI